MSQTIDIENFSRLNIKEVTELDADAAAAQANVTLKNTQSLAVNDYALLSHPGAEVGEVRQIQSITDATDVVLTANLGIPHNRFERFTTLFGNKIRIYRSANVDGTPPANDDFALLDTIDIDPDQKATRYTDPDGDDTYWYKQTYYNSTSASETSLADSRAVRGSGSSNTPYCSIEDIRKEAGMVDSRYISDGDIDKKRQLAMQEINSALTGIYALPFTEPINALIRTIATDLAAGLMLLVDYGPTSVLNTTNGQQKVDSARALLERLNTKELVLVDETGVSTAIQGTGSGWQSWPNATTADAEPENGGGPRMSRVSDRY